MTTYLPAARRLFVTLAGPGIATYKLRLQLQYETDKHLNKQVNRMYISLLLVVLMITACLLYTNTAQRTVSTIGEV